MNQKEEQLIYLQEQIHNLLNRIADLEAQLIKQHNAFELYKAQVWEGTNKVFAAPSKPSEPINVRPMSQKDIEYYDSLLDTAQVEQISIEKSK